CRKAGLKIPDFIESGDSVKVVFKFIPDVQLSNTGEEDVLKLFSMRESVSISEVIELYKISRNTATRRLNKLVIANKLRRTGKGPAVRYFLQ
ncbi:MAG TPA: DeoR family transcriptional regulator, partial [Gammaproteobacteria bacterium]|nr:DeoR family transcriptional regulator [Gammaproteobacteria bacterium]